QQTLRGERNRACNRRNRGVLRKIRVSGRAIVQYDRGRVEERAEEVRRVRGAGAHETGCEQARDETDGCAEGIVCISRRNDGAHGNAGWRRHSILAASGDASLCRRSRDGGGVDHPRRRRPQHENKNIARSVPKAWSGGRVRSCWLILSFLYTTSRRAWFAFTRCSIRQNFPRNTRAGTST